jgi:peptide/nickel transport system substrate-binding protein
MRIHLNFNQITLCSLFLLVIMAGCGGKQAPSVDQGTATPEATPTVELTTEPLVVCLGEAPDTLYPYGNPNSSAQLIIQAVYDSPVDVYSYGYLAGILTQLPSLTDGSAQLQAVYVQPGQTVLASDGQPRPLAPGVLLRPAGCRSEDCSVVYDGSPLQMDQLSATFQLRDGLAWADGTPLTAQDSVYAFQVNSDPGTPASKYETSRTAGYQALDDKRVQWTGVPGFLDPGYQSNFWTPLPQHQVGGGNPAQLATTDILAKTPMGYGPFIVVEWGSSQITLHKNPIYSPAPKMDQLIFKVVGTDGAANLQRIQNGECHVLDEKASEGIDAATLMSLQNEGKIRAAWADSGAWEALYIGIRPYSYDQEGYRQVSGDRPAFFGDPRTRQAIALCLDRQGLLQSLSLSPSALMNTYLPSSHPLYNASAAVYGYDPNAASNLLGETGWSAYSSGPRTAISVAEITGNVPFEISYYHLNDATSTRVAQALAANLNNCGIQVTLFPLSAEQLYATGEGAPVFGRNFDLAQFSWQTSLQPPCSLFLSQQVPGEDLTLYPYNWGGANISGWQNADYDAACQTALGALPGEAAYAQGYQQAQAIFAEQLPAIPLFVHQQAVVARPDLCGLDYNATTGLLWNVEKLAYGQYCGE